MKSEKSDAAVARVRSVLIARGSSLRAWGIAWAARRGAQTPAQLQSGYNTVKRTVERWAGRDDLPRPGTLGAQIMAALRADLGPWVIPAGDDLTKPPAERRQSPRT